MRDSVHPGRQAVNRVTSNWPPASLMPTICNPYSPHRPPATAVCPIHLNLAGWVTEEQLTAADAEHGHWVESDKARPSALYSICSLCSAGQLAECRAWVNDPRQSASANFRWRAVRVSPRISRILADRRPQADASAVRITEAFEACFRFLHVIWWWLSWFNILWITMEVGCCTAAKLGICLIFVIFVFIRCCSCQSEDSKSSAETNLSHRFKLEGKVAVPGVSEEWMSSVRILVDGGQYLGLLKWVSLLGKLYFFSIL